MDLHVSLSGRGDLTGQIYRQIRTAILDGRLRPGEALPPTRELAGRLSVSRNTVSVAYDRLTAEGFLAGRVGVGTYVSDRVGQHAPARPPQGGPEPQPQPVWADLPPPPDLSAVSSEYDFRAGMPDAREFPFATWRGLLADQLRSTVHAGKYGDAAGHPALRQAIARHIGVSRAVRATAEDVIVTSGFQQAAYLLARVLLAPGDVVAVETPGYPPPVRAFQAVGARVVGVPVDAEGLVVDALPAGARLVYVTPSHQFPLGVAMSLGRRLELLRWAERTGAVVIEDDYDSEFRYTGRPIEPLHSLDRAGRVAYVGSFSKTMLPGLRLGFCVGPPSLFEALRKAKFYTDWESPPATQAALAQFIDDGQFARHLRRMRRIYALRREMIAMALDRDFGGVLEPIHSGAGLHLAAWLCEPGPGAAPDLAVARTARSAGVQLYAISEYALDAPTRPGLILAYGLIAAERIDEGLARLRRCLEP